MEEFGSQEFPLIDGLPALIWVSDADHAGTYFNRTWLEFTGRSLAEERGDGWMEGVHPDDRDTLERCYSAFVDRVPFEIEFRLRRHDGVYRWMLDHGTPRFSDDGKFLGFVGSCLDITDRKAAEERQALIMGELNHRVRNILASIRAMLRLSLDSAQSQDAFADSLEGRINAYAMAHGLLAQHWDGADLRSLISLLLAPYADDIERGVELSGPDVVLQPQATIPFTLVVHELATNAAKYGALSLPKGKVTMHWWLTAQDLRIAWQEHDGPEVEAPLRRGFGSDLIEGTPKDLGGSAVLEFQPRGVRWEATIPAARIVKNAVAAPVPKESPFPARSSERKPNALEGRRILIAEDDLLTSHELSFALETTGAEIVGPATTLAEAISIARWQEIDGAVLDVSLHGELTAPVAELLSTHDIPFIVVSGYSQGQFPPAMRGAPRLQKPTTPTAVIERLSSLLTSV